MKGDAGFRGGGRRRGSGGGGSGGGSTLLNCRAIRGSCSRRRNSRGSWHDFQLLQQLLDRLALVGKLGLRGLEDAALILKLLETKLGHVFLELRPADKASSHPLNFDRCKKNRAKTEFFRVANDSL